MSSHVKLLHEMLMWNGTGSCPSEVQGSIDVACPSTLNVGGFSSSEDSSTHHKIMAFLAILVLSLYINGMCLMSELVLCRVEFLKSEGRSMLDLFSHLFIGPISVIAFICRDSVSTMLFFAALWHFFTDANDKTRPSNMLLVKSLCRGEMRATKRTVHWLRWFLSLLYFTHHTWLGTAKLALNENVLPACQAPVPLMIWLIGSGLCHLSFAMNDYDIVGGATVRAMGVLCRMGADASIVILLYEKQQVWAVLAGADFAWWCLLLIIINVEACFFEKLNAAEVAEINGSRETEELLDQMGMTTKLVSMKIGEARRSAFVQQSHGGMSDGPFSQRDHQYA